MEVWIGAGLAGLFGLAVGSFLNVLITRLPDPDRELMTPTRSVCPNCGTQIQARDNIPVISYLFLGGKCRHCQEPIHWMYPMVELFTAVIFAGSFVLEGATLAGLELVLFLTLLLAIAATDARTYLIPNIYTFGGAVVGAGLAGLQQGWFRGTGALLEALLAGGVLYLVGWMVTKSKGREAMGFGDVLLLGMITSFLSLGEALMALFLGAAIGIIPGLWQARQHEEGHIPFGVYLAIGGGLMALLGHLEILAYYPEIINGLFPWH